MNLVNGFQLVIGKVIFLKKNNKICNCPDIIIGNRLDNFENRDINTRWPDIIISNRLEEFKYGYCCGELVFTYQYERKPCEAIWVDWAWRVLGLDLNHLGIRYERLGV